MSGKGRMHRGPAVADRGPRSIRVYSTEAHPRLLATIRRADSGGDDALLRAYGWKRVGEWTREDDMPDDHAVVTVERVDREAVEVLDPDIDALDRDQASGRERRREAAT